MGMLVFLGMTGLGYIIPAIITGVILYRIGYFQFSSHIELIIKSIIAGILLGPSAFPSSHYIGFFPTYLSLIFGVNYPSPAYPVEKAIIIFICATTTSSLLFYLFFLYKFKKRKS